MACAAQWPNYISSWTMNPLVAGVYSHTPLVCALNTQLITREPTGAAKLARQQTKVRDEKLLMNTFKLNFEVTAQVKVRSNTWTLAFSSMGLATLYWTFPAINSVRTVHDTLFKCYTSVIFIQGSVMHKSGSMSSQPCKNISSKIKVAFAADGHDICFMYTVRRILDGDIYFIKRYVFGRKRSILQMHASWFQVMTTHCQDSVQDFGKYNTIMKNQRCDKTLTFSSKNKMKANSYIKCGRYEMMKI